MMISDDVVNPGALLNNRWNRAHEFLRLVEKTLTEQKTGLGELVAKQGDFVHAFLKSPAFVRSLAQSSLKFLRGDSTAQSGSLLNIEIEREPKTERQRGRDCGDCGKGRLIPSDEFLETINITRWTRIDGLVLQKPLNIRRQ